ncbi:MAG: hypothetical protein KKA81_01820 [Bacteroidetes bacterium]|nr:hypothetical protein [Bacteroidota bacterium]
MAFTTVSFSQSIGDYIGDESAMYAETKQVNQFFRRFNGEEDVKGERYYPKDSEYRSYKLRKKYLPILFDMESGWVKPELREEFIEHVNGKKESLFLDFHGGEWFAELKTLFYYQGVEKELTLYLELQQEKVGSKWVISHVFFPPFQDVLKKTDTSVFNDSKFLHPLSHELGFMNIFRVFNDSDSLEYYLRRDYNPDYLSLFLYEIKKGNLRFKTVTTVRFHFFQVSGWYFELSYFNRPGYNTGWLISNLLKINNNDEEVLKKYIYHEQ